MKKRLIGLLLIAILILPLLASCNREVAPPEIEAPIYTLYTIADATPEAIRSVELALNRILFYRLGVCIDLIAVSEEEYDQLIEEQYAIVEAEDAAKKNKKSTPSDESENGSEESALYDGVLTGEKIIELLEEGIDIHPKKNRLDIFLVRGFEKYFSFASEGKLAALDEKLTSEAKLINDYIHSSLFAAAKVNKKTYGIPVNKKLGSYKYIVFDTELLNKYNFDQKTMFSLEDLEEYLEVIKTNEPEITPLKQAIDTKDFSFMFKDGFAAYIDDNGVVQSTYEDTNVLEYYAMLARYNSYGYFGNSADDKARFAVTFVSGSEEDIAELSEQTGYEYSYNVYQNPVATNEDSIENIFVVSKFVIANELTDVSKVLAQIFTESEIQDLLTYGVQNTHYILNENEQVRRISEDYNMNPAYTGNRFLTHTLEGDDPEKWEKAKKHNIDSIPSKALGFDVIPDSFSYTDDDNNEIKIYEPNYRNIIQEVIDRYYPSIINGTIIDLDIETLKAESHAAVYQEISDDLLETYKERISEEYSSTLRNKLLNSPKAQELRAKSEEKLISDILDSVRSILKARLTSKYREELGPNATDEEIDEKVNQELTDELVEENLYLEYSEEEVEILIEATFENAISGEVNTQLNDYYNSDAFERAISSAEKSAEFKQELDQRFANNGDILINETMNSEIANMLLETSKTILEDINTELETAINTFVDENSEKLGMTKDEILEELGYLKKASSTGEDEDEDEDDDKEITYEEAFDSYFDFVLDKITKQYYLIYPLPES